MLSLSQLKPIQRWRMDKVIPVCVGADVGGSGIRIRFSSKKDNNKFIDLDHIKATSTKQLLGVLDNVSTQIKKYDPRIRVVSAALAVAGPNTQDSVTMTNWPGSAEERTFKASQLPNSLFPHGNTIFLNDLEAGSYGILASSIKGDVNKYFEQMWPDQSPKGKIVSDSRTAVLAMGSGLGVGMIIKTALAPKPLVIATELGHLQIPQYGIGHPISEKDWPLLQFVTDYYYGGKIAPEFEDIGCGRGLRLAYLYLMKQKTGKDLDFEKLDGGEIAQMAENGDPIAREAVTIQLQMLVRLAKGVGTALNCDSLILALDNQVSNNYLMHLQSDLLRLEFQTYIRPNWMKVIRLYTQTKKLNFNVLGADYVAHNSE